MLLLRRVSKASRLVRVIWVVKAAHVRGRIVLRNTASVIRRGRIVALYVSA